MTTVIDPATVVDRAAVRPGERITDGHDVATVHRVRDRGRAALVHVDGTPAGRRSEWGRGDNDGGDRWHVITDPAGA